MVQLRLCRASGGDGAEWLLLELQGEVAARDGAGLAGRLLGDLHFTRQGAPVLLLGHHILHGKAVRLERPVAVLRRGGPGAHYSAVALVKRKLLFKTRPRPIITSLPRRA